MAEIHTSDEAVSPGEDWEIAVTTEMKHKMVGPCKLGSSSNSQVDSLGIELFKPVLTDYQHALMDGPWFVGDQYLHVQPWEADFHVGNKLGKLLKIDAVTSATSWGRFARLCVQFNITSPLPKCVKIENFWQDIVYENMSLLCF
ncbi:hypothetical protein CFP56_005990 [Quercus suber]|uniref:DUF4283 domain-containing protein n=1 Tax=Quercus suber TaxID=58331 RepID=A0AAW0M879_QUESU